MDSAREPPGGKRLLTRPCQPRETSWPPGLQSCTKQLCVFMPLHLWDLLGPHREVVQRLCRADHTPIQLQAL